jgi:spore photoproduct lyase
MKISTVFVEREVARDPNTVRILKTLNAPFKIVDTSEKVFDLISKAEDPIEQGKHTLLLSKNRGAFIKNCPGTREYLCCGYKILHTASFCHMDCSYCILQTYFHPPVLQYFVNQDDMLGELKGFLEKNGISRIGTGEFSDSMIWRGGFDSTRLLVEIFAAQARSILELKTKSVSVETLADFSHNRKTILAWSLNTPRIIASEERRTSSLHARLKAAQRCEGWGYPLAFHFDPIVLYDGCEDDYKQVVREIFTHVSADNIVWISLGTLRFMPALKRVIQRRFPASKIVYAEFIRGLDGKMRYFKPLRINFYKQMVAWIREFAPEVCIYFCMEDEEVWESCIGFAPQDGGVSDLLDKAAIRHCDLKVR